MEACVRLFLWKELFQALGGSGIQQMGFLQDFGGMVHTDVNTGRKKNSVFLGLILGLLGTLKVYHGRCSSCVMHYSESTAGDDFIPAWWIYTAGWVCNREKQEYQMRNTVGCLQSNL